MICPNALTVDSNTLTIDSSALTVDSNALTVIPNILTLCPYDLMVGLPNVLMLGPECRDHLWSQSYCAFSLLQRLLQSKRRQSRKWEEKMETRKVVQGMMPMFLIISLCP